MGRAVVHFEVIGKDPDKLHSYYSDLFGWEVDASNPMKYGVVQRDGNTNAAPFFPASSVSSSGARNLGTGAERALWFLVGPSTRPVRAASSQRNAVVL